MKEWLRELYETCCRCKLSVIGNVIGWFGVVYRSVATIAVAIYMSQLPNERNIYSTLFIFLLTYCFTSLLANCLLLVGISKENHKYLIFYLANLGFEVGLLFVVLIAAIVFFIKLGSPNVLSYLIPCGVTFLGIYFYLWHLLMRLFAQFKAASEDTLSLKSRSSDLKQFHCSVGCFKSASLDIQK